MSAPLGRNGVGKYRIRKGQKHEAPSVTSVVGLLDKPGLSWGAAKETALFAIHHQNEWIDLEVEAAYERLRRHHRGIWDAKADTGSIVHDIAVSWSQGEEVDTAALIHLDDRGRERVWAGGPEEPFRRVNGCLDALERFYDEQQPVWIATEQTVFNTGTENPETIDSARCYAGSFDWTAKLADGRIIRGDWKTGSRYPTETTLQLAAYEFAPFVGVYTPDGQVEAVEANRPTDARAVVYLRDDGTYELLELPANNEAFQIFMRLRLTKAWLDSMAKWVKDHPAPEINEEKETAQ